MYAWDLIDDFDDTMMSWVVCELCVSTYTYILVFWMEEQEREFGVFIFCLQRIREYEESEGFDVGEVLESVRVH